MSSYTVTRIRGCRTIDRPVPIDDFVALVDAWEKRSDPDEDGKWFIDSLLSDKLGCSFVCGPKPALNAWRAELGLELMK